MTIDIVRELCNKGVLRWTNHIFMRLMQRNITIDDVKQALMNGEIIEQYPNDYPYPSCLVLGLTVSGKYLHVVCGTNDVELWLITAYYPNPDEWTDNFRTREK
ncbi:hypothetical protein FACS189485_04950 [Spirochaetia bacterium]|nr:hypothetical protein FACS189485_04950 [Spirochaetia bacterium]